MSIVLQDTSVLIAHPDSLILIKTDGSRETVKRSFEAEELSLSGNELPLPDDNNFKILLKDSPNLTVRSPGSFAQAFIGSAISGMVCISETLSDPIDNSSNQPLELDTMLRHPNTDFHFKTTEVWVNPSKITDVQSIPGKAGHYKLSLLGKAFYECTDTRPEIARIVERHQSQDMALAL